MIHSKVRQIAQMAGRIAPTLLPPLYVFKYLFGVCFSWLFMYLPLESLCVLTIVKLNNQVPDLWERVKVYFAGILKSGLTINLYIKLISS